MDERKRNEFKLKIALNVSQRECKTIAWFPTGVPSRFYDS